MPALRRFFLLLSIFLIGPLFVILPQEATDDPIAGEEEPPEDSAGEEEPPEAAAGEEEPPEAAAGEEEPPEAAAGEELESLTDRTLAQDILTAGFRDLISWNASLNLSTRGGRRELEDRLFDYYGVRRPPADPPAEGSEIIIESARSTRYFTIEAPEENYLVLRGGVLVQMRDAEGDERHLIEADQVVYNQSQNTLSASGNITYTVEGGDSTEVYNGDSLQFRLDSWDGIFLEGETRRTQEGGEEGRVEEFSVQGNRLSRSPQEITVVEEGSITSSLADPPNYSIDATKIWVLAPGEWGIQNAVLRVGRIPVFYFPFFFLPGDKLFFHPSVGTEPRRGSYIQTTTYLIGARREQDQGFSLVQLADPVDESLREIEGLFLVLPENPEPPEQPNWYLKVMADIYTKLGGYVGLETDLPNLGFLRRFFMRSGIGASRTVFSDQAGSFTPYYVDENGEARSNWESGWFLGNELPFRYETELDLSTSLPYLSLSLEMLLLSDPEFRADFGPRQEQFDWSVLLSSLEPLESDAESRRESLTWRFQSSLSPSIPSLSPWVTSLSVERLNATLDWRSRQWPEDRLPLPLQQNSYTASGEAEFFYPSELTAPDGSLRVQGEILSYPFRDRRPSDQDDDDDGAEDEDEESDTTTPAEQLRPPWEPPQEDEETDEGEIDEGDQRLPAPFENRSGIVDQVPLNFRLRYQVVPTLTIDNVTDADEWETPEEIDGSVAYSTLQHSGNYQLSYDGYLYDRLFTFNGSLLMALRYQELLDDQGVTEGEGESLREQAFRGRSRRLTQSNNVAYAPLRNVERLEESRLRYNISMLLYERAFSEFNEESGPQYEERTIEVTDDFFQTHRTTADIRVKALRATQALTVAAALPPLDGRYDSSITAVTGPLTSSASTAYVEDSEEGWRFEPLQTTQTLAIIENDLSLSQRFVVELEEEELTRSVTSLNAWFASFAYEARRSPVYEFDPQGEGWTRSETEELQPYRFTVGIDALWEPAPFWKRRVVGDANLNASYEANLLRFTESSLRLSYGFSLSVYRFLDLRFEAVTVNDFTYQYIPSLAERADREQRSLLGDLGNSLALFSREQREESFFTLDRISLSAVHDLQDWELTVRYDGSPTLESGGGERSRYRWDNVLSIFLRWRPIPEIQSTITYDDGELDVEN